MAVTTDILNTVLADLKGPVEHSLAQKSVAHKLLVSRGKVSTERGSLIERVIMGGSPAQGTGIYGSGETLNLTRTEQTHKIQLQTHRVVVPISIPKKDMIENEGKLGAIKLVKEYVGAVEALLPVDVDRHLLGGVSYSHVLASNEMQGWNTLNGQKVFSKGVVGVTNGLIDFVAGASQTDTVQNLAKSSSYNYVNQFDEVTSYAIDGDKTYRAILREIGRWDVGGKTACLMDFDSFALVEQDNRDHVRIVRLQDKTDNGSDGYELPFANTTIYATPGIVLTDFTGSAAEGLAYFLNLDGIEWVWYQKPTMLDFEDRIANQDAVVAKLEMQGQIVMRNMRAQGAVVGGARA